MLALVLVSVVFIQVLEVESGSLDEIIDKHWVRFQKSDLASTNVLLSVSLTLQNNCFKEKDT